MKAVLVDDEKLGLDYLETLCSNIPVLNDIKSFTRSKNAYKWCEDNPVDIIILDINMPDINGITLVTKLREIKPDIRVIFVTAYEKYALDAFGVHADGYLLKPVNQENLTKEVEYALSDVNVNAPNHIVVKTFGGFEVLVDGEPVTFSRSKSKELFAYLIDRQGRAVNRANIFSILWEDGVYDRSKQKQLDVIIRSLKSTLQKCGISEILEMHSGSIRVRTELINCDMYKYLEGDKEAQNSYQGTYMTPYSWASFSG